MSDVNRVNWKDKCLIQLSNSDFVKKIKDDAWLRDLVDKIEDEAWKNKKDSRDYMIDMSKKLKQLSTEEHLYKYFEDFFQKYFRTAINQNGNRGRPDVPNPVISRAGGEHPNHTGPLTSERPPPTIPTPAPQTNPTPVIEYKNFLQHLDSIRKHQLLKQYSQELATKNETALVELVTAIYNGKSLEAKFHEDPNDFREKIRTIIHGLNGVVEKYKGSTPHTNPATHPNPHVAPHSTPYNPPHPIHNTAPHPPHNRPVVNPVTTRDKEEIRQRPVPQARTDMFEQLHRQFRKPFTPLEFCDKISNSFDEDPKKKLKGNPISTYEKNMLETN
jgi:hypothetical protein